IRPSAAPPRGCRGCADRRPRGRRSASTYPWSLLPTGPNQLVFPLAEEQTGQHAATGFLSLSATLLDQPQFKRGVGVVRIDLQRLAEGVHRRIRVLGPPEDAGHVVGARRGSRRPQRTVD